jgi:hypothetical protein
MEKVPEKFKVISQNDCGGCFKAWKAHIQQHVASNGNYCEKDNQ